MKCRIRNDRITSFLGKLTFLDQRVFGTTPIERFKWVGERRVHIQTRYTQIFPFWSLYFARSAKLNLKGVMRKQKEPPVPSHVKFTPGDYRPYVEPIDLVTSKNFKESVERAMKKWEESNNKTEESKK